MFDKTFILLVILTTIWSQKYKKNEDEPNDNESEDNTI